jgi:FkbM family methyltransferase
MNFSGISNKAFVGHVLRMPLTLIPKSLPIRILQGRLRGMRWIAGSHTHGCWLGSYEYEKRLAFERIVQPGQIVFDVGANVGFYTLLASVLVGPGGRVFAFEPIEQNLVFLRKHLSLNHALNVTVLAVAASDHKGTALFDTSSGRAMGSLGDGGSLRVDVITLDELIDTGELPVPNYIKLDVEGAELRVLKGAAKLLAKHHPVLFVSIHSAELRSQCCEMLAGLEYELIPMGTHVIAESDEFIAAYHH